MTTSIPLAARLVLVAVGALLLTAPASLAQEYTIPESINPMNAAALGGRSMARTSAAPALIDNGVIQLGVNETAELNVGSIGLTYLVTGNEATAPGCPCEGWGVKDTNTGIWGGANQSLHGGPTNNVVLVSFTNDASTATSVVDVLDLPAGAPGATPIMRVTHEYFPSTVPNLYRVNVTIQNVSGADQAILYRRVMDWDVEPTPFAEFVTIQGTAGNPNVTFASDDGFSTSEPGNETSILFIGDAVDSGPADHGALFDFDLGTAAPGGSVGVVTFYGATGDEATALSAVGSVGAGVYSLGQTSTTDGPTLGTPNTFIFGFLGVGGEPPPPACDASDISQSVDAASEKITLTVNDPEGISGFGFRDNIGVTVFDNLMVSSVSPAGYTSADGINYAFTGGGALPTSVVIELMGVNPGSGSYTVRYNLEVVNACDPFPVTTNLDPVFDLGSEESVSSYALEAAFPNPFDRTTTLAFRLPESQHVTLTVYDVVGRQVATLADDTFDAGRHTVEWDGRDASGQAAAAGVYIYHIEAGAFSATQRMIVIR